MRGLEVFTSLSFITFFFPSQEKGKEGVWDRSVDVKTVVGHHRREKERKAGVHTFLSLFFFFFFLGWGLGSPNERRQAMMTISGEGVSSKL